MKVGEIKAELDLRGVTYAGVFERPELEALLLTYLYNREEESSRAGRAAPDFDWDAAKAGDGNLPGGVDPEALQTLTSSHEMMEITSNPRLQVRLLGVEEYKCAGLLHSPIAVVGVLHHFYPTVFFILTGIDEGGHIQGQQDHAKLYR